MKKIIIAVFLYFNNNSKKKLQDLYIFYIFKKIGIICRRAYKPVYAIISGEKWGVP